MNFLRGFFLVAAFLAYGNSLQAMQFEQAVRSEVEEACIRSEEYDHFEALSQQFYGKLQAQYGYDAELLPLFLSLSNAFRTMLNKTYKSSEEDVSSETRINSMLEMIRIWQEKHATESDMIRLTIDVLHMPPETVNTIVTQMRPYAIALVFTYIFRHLGDHLDHDEYDEDERIGSAAHEASGLWDAFDFLFQNIMSDGWPNADCPLSVEVATEIKAIMRADTEAFPAAKRIFAAESPDFDTAQNSGLMIADQEERGQCTEALLSLKKRKPKKRAHHANPRRAGGPHAGKKHLAAKPGPGVESQDEAPPAFEL